MWVRSAPSSYSTWTSGTVQRSPLIVVREVPCCTTRPGYQVRSLCQYTSTLALTGRLCTLGAVCVLSELSSPLPAVMSTILASSSVASAATSLAVAAAVLKSLVLPSSPPSTAALTATRAAHQAVASRCARRGGYVSDPAVRYAPVASRPCSGGVFETQPLGTRSVPTDSRSEGASCRSATKCVVLRLS